MKVKDFIEYWQKAGFSVRVRTVAKVQTWCFTCAAYTFFIPATAILAVADAIAKYGKA